MASKRKLIGFAAFAALSGLAALGVSGNATEPGRAARAPDFALTNGLTSDTLSLAAFQDSPVLLFFFDAGSMQSLAAAPYVSEWHRRYAGDGLKVLGIHWSELPPMKSVLNVYESTYRRKAAFPLAIDSTGAVSAAYGVTVQPSYFLVHKGMIVLETSEPKPYAEVETAIQQVLLAGKPDIKVPFLVRPLAPADDPARKVLRAAPQIVLGYLSGAIVGADSAARDTFYNYTDSRGRERGKVYLQGYWKVGPNSMSHAARLGSSGDRIRVIYSGKEVWLLPWYPYEAPQRIYVKQDKVYPDKSVWGKDLYGDEVGMPYIRMKCSVPVHVISNKTFGTHEIELIPAEGDVALCYIFFEDGVAD